MFTKIKHKLLSTRPNLMQPYYDHLREVRNNGYIKHNERTGAKTWSLFGHQMRFRVTDGQYPMLTARPVPFNPMKAENFWFLSGNTNRFVLNERNCKVWDEWAVSEDQILEFKSRVTYAENTGSDIGPYDADRLDDMIAGDLGPIYGEMFRAWPAPNGRVVDQIKNLIASLKTNPMSRRHVISAWNPAFLPDESLTPQENVLRGKQALAPCHTLFQLYVREMTIAERLRELPLWWSHKKVCTHADVSLVTKAIAKYKSNKPMTIGSITPYNVPYEQVLDIEDIKRIHAVLDEHICRRYALSMKLYARSQDLPLGTAFNIPAYTMLLHMFAHATNMKPWEYIHTMGDSHIYENQIEGVDELLRRVDEHDGGMTLPKCPKLVISVPGGNWDAITESSLSLHGYNPIKPGIKFPITV